MRISEKMQAFELDSLPGCSQVAVSHGMFIRSEYRGEGNAKECMAYRLDTAIDLGYDYVICTVDMDNTPQVKTLNSTGWTCLDTFVSERTGHAVALYGKHLKVKVKKWYDYVNGHAAWEE